LKHSVYAAEVSNMTDLWPSGVFFQALNTPKLVFGPLVELMALPIPPSRLWTRHPLPISARRVWRLDLGCQYPHTPTQIPGYA